MYKKRILTLALVFVMVMMLYAEHISIMQVYAADSRIENAINWAYGIAGDNSHGYSQANRWGYPDYDCSSFVIGAFRAAGFSIYGATYTQNMVPAFTGAGFVWIPAESIDLSSGYQLQRGDILLNNSSDSSKQHTEIYLGNGQTIGAFWDWGSPASGDQSGNEISVHGYYNHPWTGILRYAGASEEPCSCKKSYAGDYFVATKNISLYMRTGHGSNYAAITKIPSKAVVHVTKADGTWAHVKYNGEQGYCNMKYLKRVENAVAPKIKIWLTDRTRPGQSGEALGADSFRYGGYYYLCYELVNPETGERFDGDGYSVKETIYKPSGDKAQKAVYDNSPYNYIACTADESGDWKGKVEISGEFKGKVSLDYSVPDASNIAMHAYFSEDDGTTATTLEKGKSYTLDCELIQRSTGKLFNELVEKGNYTIRLTVKNPDGTIIATESFAKTDRASLSFVADIEGDYVGQFEYEENSALQVTAECKAE